MTELQRQRLQVARCQLAKLAEELRDRNEGGALLDAVVLLDGAIPPTDHEMLARLTGTDPPGMDRKAG